jgi:hypothetical protein
MWGNMKDQSVGIGKEKMLLESDWWKPAIKRGARHAQLRAAIGQRATPGGDEWEQAYGEVWGIIAMLLPCAMVRVQSSGKNKKRLRNCFSQPSHHDVRSIGGRKTVDELKADDLIIA